MHIFLNATIAVLVLTVSVDAQVRTLKWTDALCEYSGSYDSKKYSESRLLNTLKLKDQGFTSLSSFPSVWKWEDIDAIDVEALETEYRLKREALTNLDVVNVPYWQRVKETQIKELDQVYTFYRTKAEAYKSPEVLRKYSAAPDCTAQYAEPLIARDDSLLKVWLEVNMHSRSQNADPDRLKRRFDEQMASPDKYKHAIVEVMGFGWGNCAVREIQRDEGNMDDTHMKEIRKLFLRVREECEMP
jgi:hypothetical protein